MKTIKLFLPIFFALACIACKSNDSMPSASIPLKGTKWKLAGIVDTQTDDLKILEPKDCKQCYTLTFDTDSTLTTYSVSNLLSGYCKINYVTQSIHITNFGGTKLGEGGDGNLWWSIFPLLQFFSVQKNELRLYYDDKKYYLLFKPCNS